MVACNESPPSSKKLSWMPMPSIPSTADQASANAFSNSDCGATQGVVRSGRERRGGGGLASKAAGRGAIHLLFGRPEIAASARDRPASRTHRPSAGASGSPRQINAGSVKPTQGCERGLHGFKKRLGGRYGRRAQSQAKVHAPLRQGLGGQIPVQRLAETRLPVGRAKIGTGVCLAIDATKGTATRQGGAGIPMADRPPRARCRQPSAGRLRR